jgi:hypothetical protein
MRLGSIEVSPDILPLTASTVLAATGIKTAIATSASAVTYSGAAINGTTAAAGIATPSPSGNAGVAQYPIAVASSSAGSYVNGSTIVFTGIRDNKTVYSTATVAGTGGNATFIGDTPLESCSSVAIAAQTDTSGQWTLGWNDVACPMRGGCNEPFRVLRPTSTGNVMIVTGPNQNRTVPVVSGGPDELVDILRVKFSNVATTVTTLNLYE